MTLETEEKIKNIRKILIEDLELVKFLDKEKFTVFCVNITNSLRYNRRLKLLSMNETQIRKMLNNLINFFDNVGLTRLDLINALSNNIGLLEIVNSPDFIDKYILLSVAENDRNSARKKMLIDNSRCLKKSINEVYVRYKITKDCNRLLSLNNIIEKGYYEFIESFVRKTYYNKSDKIFNEKKDLEDLVTEYPVDYEFISELKKLDINKNVSLNKNVHSMTKEEKIKYAIDNYYKFKNINDFSKYSGISSSSIQRYLKEDSKMFVDSKKYNEITMWLNRAKAEGLSRGGINSQNNNEFIKDEVGKFCGSRKR